MKHQSRLAWIARHSIAIVLAIMFLTPIVYLVLLSLMTSDQALTSDYWPNSWHPENYVRVFEVTPLPRYLLNTVVYAVSSTVLAIGPTWSSDQDRAITPSRLMAS